MPPLEDAAGRSKYALPGVVKQSTRWLVGDLVQARGPTGCLISDQGIPNADIAR
jgi:hypothetical protein